MRSLLSFWRPRRALSVSAPAAAPAPAAAGRRHWLRRAAAVLGTGLLAAPAAVAAVPARRGPQGTQADDPFLGEIVLLACNFPPTGFAFCHGQVLPISGNTALFALLGTYYGGDGKNTFALPDLRDRLAVGASDVQAEGGSSGPPPGLTAYSLGETPGTDQVTLTESELASHSHPRQATDDPATSSSPVNGVLADANGVDAKGNAAALRPYNSLSANAVGLTTTVGENQPQPNLPPVLALNYCIATRGVFPPRY